MKVKILTLGLLLSTTLFAETEWRIENSNFLLSQASYVPLEDERYTVDYNRFRLRADWKENNFFATAIGDGVSYLGSDFTDSLSFGYIKALRSDTPFQTQTSFNDFDNGSAYAKINRLYAGYDDGKNRVVAGLQNINIGSGHIWTPSNLFNPKNTYALEPDETFPVLALYGSHYITEKTQFYAAVSQRRDHSFKYLGGVKQSFDTMDIALNVIHSEQTTMLGYSIVGDLSDTGIEVRSEGAYIQTTEGSVKSTEDETDFFQGLIGADYAFQNGLNLTVEALYSSKIFTYRDAIFNLNSELNGNMTLSHFYTGVMMNYDFNIYLSGALLYIESFNDSNSRFVSPTLTYTLNDNNRFDLGALIQGGPEGSEFGMFGNTYYVKYIFSY
ncbi:MAG TPA: hypothetical protein ENJ71_02380 [Epsilonproteobacteria bacterium]|nr:hypothetical protein [Campylobacterota bacterium]